MKLYSSLRTLQADLYAGETTCVEVVKNYMAQIELHQDLNAFVEVFEESTLRRAEGLDQLLAQGQKGGKLMGMVIGLKDNILYQGHACTSASKILEGFVSPYSSTVVERLLAEGAIIIGRLNADEFSMGSSNENSYYGPVKNPVNSDYVPGGSSGGPAAAVAANLCMAALGSDTGGSVRQPAAFCGIVGVKPTYGRVSRYGLVAYASSFDQIGPLTNQVEDAALILEVIAGLDQKDPTSSSKAVDAYAQFSEKKKTYRIAYYKDEIEDTSVHADVKKSTLDLIEKLKAEGHQVEPIKLAALDYAPSAYYILTTAEASSNLARYDGIRYGYRAENAEDLDDIYKKSRSEGFGDEVKRRIMAGAFVLSKNNYQDFYIKALKARRIIAEKTVEVFENYDFILSPIAPNPPFKLGSRMDNPVAMYLSDVFTVQANLAGIPAIALPIAKSQEGLPIGVQFMANLFEEKKLLEFSQQLVKEL